MVTTYWTDLVTGLVEETTDLPRARVCSAVRNNTFSTWVAVGRSDYHGPRIGEDA